jgi:hypothetical protein
MKLLFIAILAIVVGIVPTQTFAVTSVFGQVAQLQQLPTTIATQCIDLNQDRICEAVILANGTMINFTSPTPKLAPITTVNDTGLTTYTDPNTGLVHDIPIVGSYCIDFNEDNPCFVNGKMIGKQTQTVVPEVEKTTWTDPDTGLVYDIPTQGDYCLDFNEDAICDVDFTNGKMVVYDEPETQIEDEEDAVGERGSRNDDNGNDNNRDDKALPYCDKFDGVDNWPDSGCHDRKDYYDGGPKDGLYPCNDGTDKEDWRDCKDASGYDYDESNDDNNNDEDNNDEDNNDEDSKDTGGSNPEGEEEDQSCGGESCTDDEKEDSTTDEDVPLFG